MVPEKETEERQCINLKKNSPGISLYLNIIGLPGQCDDSGWLRYKIYPLVFSPIYNLVIKLTEAALVIIIIIKFDDGA